MRVGVSTNLPWLRGLTILACWLVYCMMMPTWERCCRFDCDVCIIFVFGHSSMRTFSLIIIMIARLIFSTYAHTVLSQLRRCISMHHVLPWPITCVSMVRVARPTMILCALATTDSPIRSS